MSKQTYYSFEATFTDDVCGYEIPALIIHATNYASAVEHARQHALVNDCEVSEVVNVF